MSESERYQFGLSLVLREGGPLLKHLTPPTGKLVNFLFGKAYSQLYLPTPSRPEAKYLAHKQLMRPPIPRVAHDVTQCQFGNISTDSSVTCLPSLAFSLVRETL